MSSETERIRQVISQNWDGQTWHGSNLKEILQGITIAQAFAKPSKASHNIYEYVRHMAAWRNFGIEQLKGNTEFRITLNTEADWITDYPQTEEEWLQTLHDLEACQAKLLEALDNFKEDMLDEPMNGRKFSWYSLLHGIVHHDIYHSAQISLLKKLLG